MAKDKSQKSLESIDHATTLTFKNAWTSTEINEFIRLVKEYGRNFKIIAEKLGTRTFESVNSKALKMLQKMDSGQMQAD